MRCLCKVSLYLKFPTFPVTTALQHCKFVLPHSIDRRRFLSKPRYHCNHAGRATMPMWRPWQSVAPPMAVLLSYGFRSFHLAESYFPCARRKQSNGYADDFDINASLLRPLLFFRHCFPSLPACASVLQTLSAWRMRLGA